MTSAIRKLSQEGTKRSSPLVGALGKPTSHKGRLANVATASGNAQG